MSKDKTELNIKELEKAFDGDLDLVLFLVTYLKNGLNATAAYRELHPDVTNGSAEVLGSRTLGRVKPDVLASIYGLGVKEWFDQLKEGLAATKWNDFTGEREADHKTRDPYHTKLGKVLGIEVQGPNVAVQINNIIPILGGKTNVSGNNSD
ncbi:MAG: hypothetical protein M0P59_13455 [Gallionella sp.]|jgi:hypothetical protein|nr:hypothetical protein [Gallionella sp.]